MTVTAKICGINDPEALRAAVSGGASHVGFVFYPPSPRAVRPGEAMALAASVPERVQKVGLFVDAKDEEIDRTLFMVRLDILQLHGDEGPDRVRDLKSRTGKKVMKVIKVADWLMFDAKPPEGMANALPGGNALSFDWRLLSGRNWPLPWMLAGGLNAGNVSDAVRLSGAPVVDTSSGVEDAPGRKSVEKIRDFLKTVTALR